MKKHKSITTWQRIKDVAYNLFVWFNVIFFSFLAYECIRDSIVIPVPYRDWEHYKGQWDMENPVNYFCFSYILGAFFSVLVYLILKFKKKHPRCVWIGISALYMLYLLCFFIGVVLQWLGWYIPH